MLEDAQGWLNKRAMNETKDLQGIFVVNSGSGNVTKNSSLVTQLFTLVANG